MTDSPVRVGVLGAGAISQLVHLPILGGRDDVEVVALADKDNHKAESIARRFSVPTVTDDRSVLSNPEIDAVLVCTPNYLHEEHAIAALESGKHVLVERPLAITSEGASRILDAARASGRQIMMNTAHRFRSDTIALYSFVAGGALGEVFSVQGSLLNRKLAVRSSWRHRTREAGGGALMDLGVPILDLCLWLIGYPEIRRVSAASTMGEGEVEDGAAVLVETATGVSISVLVSWTLFSDQDRYQAQVLGRAGSGSIPPLSVFRQIGGRPISVTPEHPTVRENPYMVSHRRLLDRFVGMAAGVRAVDLPLEQVRLLRVVEAAYRSAREGRDVQMGGGST